MPLLPRIPLPLLPLCIKATSLLRDAAEYVSRKLLDLEGDLEVIAWERDMVERAPVVEKPKTVGPIEAAWLRNADRTCFECGTSDPTGFCPAHRVLDKGRVN